MLSGGDQIPIRPFRIGVYATSNISGDGSGKANEAPQEANIPRHLPVSYPVQRFTTSLFRNDLPATVNGREEGKTDRLQLAATSSDKKNFDILKDDPDLEVRLALLKNANFRDQPWFQEFKNLYESYKRLQTIALGNFATQELDSLKTDADLRKIVPEFEKLLPILAKLEPEPRIRYAIALNKTLTDAERALFANDSFLPIHRRWGTKKKIIELYDLIEKLEKDRDGSEKWKERRTKELRAWKDSLTSEEYAQAIIEMYQHPFSDEWIPASRIEEYYLPLLPLSTEQIEKVYPLASDKMKASLMTQENLPEHLATDFAKKFQSNPKMLLALAKSPHINALYDGLVSQAGMDVEALHREVIRNPVTSADVIRKVVQAMGYVNDEAKAILLKHKNTPLDLRREFTKDRLAFRRLVTYEKNIDPIIEEIYLSKDFTVEERKERLAILQEEMADYYYKEDLLSPDYFGYLSSRYAPREALRKAILKGHFHLFSIEAIASRRMDLTKEELTVLLKLIPAQVIGIIGGSSYKLFAHPNLDSEMILTVVEYVEKVREESYHITSLQFDLIQGFLEHHPADSRIKDWILKKLEEKEGTDQFWHYAGVSLIFAGDNLDLFRPGKPYAKELQRAFLGRLSVAHFASVIGGKERAFGWEKIHDIALGLWEKIKVKGLANEFLASLSFDPATEIGMRLVIAKTPDLDPKLYERALKKAIEDYRDPKTRESVSDRRVFYAFLEALWQNPSVPVDILIQSKGIVENLNQAIALTEALQKRGISNPDILLKLKGKLKFYGEALGLAEILKKKGYHDPELSLFLQIDAIWKKEKEDSRFQRLKELYQKDPNLFLTLLDQILSFDAIPGWLTDMVQLDFLPDSYVKKHFHSLDPWRVRQFSLRKELFNEIYLGDIPFYFRDPLKGKSVFTKAFVLTMLPGLPADEAHRSNLEKLIQALEEIELFDNSFLEYYLASQMIVIRDCFLNGYIPDEEKYPLLLNMVALIKKDVDDYGKKGEKVFFAEGRRHLIQVLLKHSIFASRVGENLTESELEKWEMVLHLGVRGVVHLKEYQEIQKRVQVGGVYGEGFLGVPQLDREKELPEHLRRDFYKAIYVVSERIKQYLASPNPEYVKQMGLQKENAFHSEGNISGDFSLVGGLTTYGGNIEGSFYAELGHHYSEHILTMERLSVQLGFRERKMNYMALYEFDDRMSSALIPPSLENKDQLREILDHYWRLDHTYLALASKILYLGEKERKELLQKLEKIKPEQFATRKNSYLFANALRVFKMALQGQSPKMFERIILGEGIAVALEEGLLQLAIDGLLSEIQKRREIITAFPFVARQAIEGGDFLSSYHNVYPMNAIPLRPVVPETLDKKGRGDFSYLNHDEQHLTAEWLVYYTKRYARSLLVEDKIEPEEYFYFVKNIPFATKRLLAERRDVEMSDVVERIRELDPKKMAPIFFAAGKPLNFNVERENRWIRRLEEKFKSNSDWTLERLEAEIARTRQLFQ